MSLRARMLGFLLLGGLLPVAALAWFVFWYIEVRLDDHLSLQLSISVEELRDEADRELFDRQRELKSLAEKPELLASPRAALDGFLRTVSRRRPYSDRRDYLCLAVLRPGGATLSQSGRCEDAGAAPAGAGAPYLSKTRALADGTPVIDAYFPAGRGETSYWLRATLDLRALSDMLARGRRTGGLDEEALIYTPEGRVVARRDGAATGALDRDFPLLSAFDAARPSARRGPLPGGREALAAVNVLVGLSPPLDSLKWKVAVIQPLDDLSEPSVLLLHQLRRGILAAALIAVLTSLGSTVLLFGSVMRPLKRLADATLRVQRGDLATPIEVGRLDELGRLARFFNEMLLKLKESRDQLTALATTDGLTGLANRRALDARLDDELKRVQRYGRTLSFALLDIDHFKRCNDAHGHPFGDAVLREVARLCSSSCRDTDFAARYGGEEFALILPETPKRDAGAVLERVRRAVEDFEFRDPASGRRARVTVSIGLSGYPDDAAGATELCAAADAALYEAKKSGRNRVVPAKRGAD